MEERALLGPEVRLRQLIEFIAQDRDTPEELRALAQDAVAEILFLFAEEPQGQAMNVAVEK